MPMTIIHFHARYGDFRAVINIVTGNIIEGSMPQKSLRLIQAWVEIHREELMANWEKGQDETPDFSRIEPIR